MLRSTLAIAIAACACRAATAQDIDGEPRREFAVWAGTGESTNISRTSDGGGSYNSVGVLLGLEHRSGRLVGGVDSDVEFRTYSEESVDNETVGTLDAFAEVDVVRDRFRWTFRETYDQGRLDPFFSMGPENRETVNVFSSGPSFDLPIGQRTNLQIGAELSARRYQESGFVDSDSVTYDFGVIRQVNQTTELGLIADSNEIDYADASIPPYEIERLSVRYSKDLATGGVRAEFGTNELSSGDAQQDEPLFDFEWSRAIGSRSTLTIAGSRGFTDAGEAFTSEPELGPSEPRGEVLLSNFPFEQKTLDISYTLGQSRTEVSIGGGVSEDSYAVDTTLDNEAVTMRLTIRRIVSGAAEFRRITQQHHPRVHRDSTAARRRSRKDGEHVGQSTDWTLLQRLLGPGEVRKK